MTQLDSVQNLSAEQAASEVKVSPRRRNDSPEYRRRLVEAAQIVGGAFAGDARAMITMKEALSTSDFPMLFGDILDRELLEQYENITPVWSGFARRSQVRDFRPKKWYDLLGGQGLLDEVQELAEYKATKLSEAEYELKVSKFGKRLPLSWETLVNDDLDAFRSAPERLAQGARDTEDYRAANQLVDANGPSLEFFGIEGAVPTAALTTDSLTDAITTVQQRRDVDNRPIVVRSQILMVPPSLEVTANKIINATEIRETSGDQTVVHGNWLRGRVRVLMNPWLPIVDGTTGSTAWYLLPEPANPRPAVVMGFLRGHETPDLRQRADTGQRVGGGAISAEDGSFDTDDIQYRVRHVLGGTLLDKMAAYASKGTT